MKPAIMVIDMQKAFSRGKSGASMEAACEYINAILPEFRKRGLPVLWVQHEDAEDGVVPGSEGFEILDLLRPAVGEERIRKVYGNSFTKTACAEILARAGVDTIVLTGYCAEHCVLSTYRGAKDADLVPVILRGAIASGCEENIGFVDRISEVICFNMLRKMLENA